MTNKTRNVVSIVVGALPAAMVLMSSIIKLTTDPQPLIKAGFGPYIKPLGIIEIVLLILFFYPKTKRIGFYLLCSYLGGAFSVELTSGLPPLSLILLTLFWVSMFIKDKNNFFPTPTIRSIN